MYDSEQYRTIDELRYNREDVYKFLMMKDIPFSEDCSFTIFPTVEDFAIYEVEDGWYSTQITPIKNVNAPDLLNYIDYERLGNDLLLIADSDYYILYEDGVIMLMD